MREARHQRAQDVRSCSYELSGEGKCIEKLDEWLLGAAGRERGGNQLGVRRGNRITVDG